MLSALIVASTLALAQSATWDRPTDLAPSATWPSPSDWQQQSVPARAPHLIRVQGIDPDGRHVSALGHASPQTDYDRVHLFGGDARQLMDALGCNWTRCELPHDHPWLRITEREGAIASQRTREAWQYATVLRRFEGPLYRLSPSPSEGSETLAPVPPVSADVQAWLTDVMATAYALPPHDRAEAAQVAFEHGRPGDALALGRTYRPMAVCSQDKGPQYYSHQLAAYAHQAGRTGLTLDATVQGFDYWGVAGIVRASRTSETRRAFVPPSLDWNAQFAGLDSVLLVYGLVADLDAVPPQVMWPVAHHVFQQLPLDDQRDLIRHARQPDLDPWHQLILLLVTGATVRGFGTGLHAVWGVSNTQPVALSSLQAQAIAVLTSDGD